MVNYSKSVSSRPLRNRQKSVIDWFYLALIVYTDYTGLAYPLNL